MHANRFDRLTRTLATNLTRRQALRGAGAGLVAAAASRVGTGLAQEASPVASPASSASAEDDQTSFMFVQTFGGGTWTPKEGEDGLYTLAFTGSSAQTIFFSDIPERIVGTAPMPSAIFTPDNPPNAALVAQIDGGEDVLVVELTNPDYDEAAATLTYDARVLENYQGEGLRFLADRQGDLTMPSEFGAASLFIDDCPNGSSQCSRCDGDQEGGQCFNGDLVDVGSITTGCCYSSSNLTCLPCRTGDNNACNTAIPACEGRCIMESSCCCCGSSGPCW